MEHALPLDEKALQNLVQQLLDAAKSRGATGADIVASVDAGFTTSCRKGEPESIEYHRDKGVGISVYYGQRKGEASTADTSDAALEQALDKACNIAKYTAEDEFAGLADKNLMATDFPDLDLYHPWDITPEQAMDKALACEAHGISYDKRISNSEGASVTTSQGMSAYGNSHGFFGIKKGSRHSISCCLLAKSNDNNNGMERDYDYTVARSAMDLANEKDVALSAAKKTIARLNGQRIATCQTPVLYQANVARGLLTHFVAAIRGSNLYRQSSFLLDSLEQQIFPNFINIKEQPYLKRGLASAAFDAEGVQTKERDLVSGGVLQGYILGSYSARKLGMQTTANAGGIHNLTISHSDKSLPQMLKDLDTGLFITELMGQGVNIVTGDYSRGASGFWVEKGEIQYPVHEITIAGNLSTMYQQIQAIGNDLDTRGAIHTGSILIESMMVAGT